MDGDTPLDGNPFRPKNPFRAPGNPFRNPAAATAPPPPTDTAPVQAQPSLAAAMFAPPTLPRPVGPTGTALPAIPASPDAQQDTELARQTAVALHAAPPRLGDILAGTAGPPPPSTIAGVTVPPAVVQSLGGALQQGSAAARTFAADLGPAAERLGGNLGQIGLALTGRTAQAKRLGAAVAADAAANQAANERALGATTGGLTGAPTWVPSGGGFGRFAANQVPGLALFGATEGPAASLAERIAGTGPTLATRTAAMAGAGAATGLASDPNSPNAIPYGLGLGAAGELALAGGGAVLRGGGALLDRLRGVPTPDVAPDAGIPPTGDRRVAVDIPQPPTSLRRRVGDFINPQAVEDRMNPVTALPGKPEWARVRPLADANPDVEVVSADGRNLKKMNDEVSADAADAQVRRQADAFRRAATELGLNPNQILYTPKGDELYAIVPKGMGQALGARAQELLGTEPVAHVPTGMRFGVGATTAEADAALNAAKAAEKGAPNTTPTPSLIEPEPPRGEPHRNTAPTTPPPGMSAEEAERLGYRARRLRIAEADLPPPDATQPPPVAEGGPSVPPANPEAGGIVKPLLGGLAGGGVGAAAGYATGSTPEERARNAVLGGLAGAGGGLLAGRALERGVTPEPPVEPSLTQRLAAEPEERPTRTPFEAPIGAQGPLRKPEANLIRTIPGLSPDAQARLQSIAAQLPAPGRESFSTITRAAEQSGLTAAEINALPANHIDRVTALAAKMLSAQGEARYSQILERLNAPDVPLSERAALDAERRQIAKDNLALYRQWQRSGTETARDLAARAAMVKALPPDPNAWIASTEDFAGRQLGDAEQATVRKLFDADDKAGLLKMQARLKPSSATEKALTIWKGGLLGPGGIPGAALGAAAGAASPADDNGQRALNTLKGAAIGSVSGAILAKATGDLTWAAFRDLSREPAGMADYLAGLVTKQRTTAAEMPFLTRIGAAMKARGEFGKALAGEPTAEELASMTPPRQTNFDTPLFQAWFNGPFRLLKGVSEVANQAAITTSLRNQAKALARQAGKRGADFAPEVERLLANPTPEMQARAIADGAYDTMTNRTAAGDALSALAKVGGPAGQVVIPFTKTPGSIATKFLADAGPVGLARGTAQMAGVIRDAINELKASGAVSDATRLRQATAANLIGQGVVGTAPILAGYLMYRAGRASGMSANVNPALKNTRRAAQIPNDAFLVNGRWVQPDRMGVPGMLMSMGAAIGQMQDIGEAKGWGAVGSGLAAAGRIVTDQPFVTGPNQAQEALQNPASFGSRYVQSLAGSVVPAAVRNTSRALDTQERDADTPLEAIQANTPFRASLPVRRDALGQPIPILPSGLQQAGSPLKVTANAIPTDPVMQELVRLNVPLGAVKRLPGESAKDYGDRQEQIGNAARAALEHVMASDAYLSGDDGVQSAMLQQALEDVHRRAALGTGPNPFTRRQSRLDRLRAAASAPTNPFLTEQP